MLPSTDGGVGEKLLVIGWQTEALDCRLQIEDFGMRIKRRVSIALLLAWRVRCVSLCLNGYAMSAEA
jgi:hypothetical protein